MEVTCDNCKKVFLVKFKEKRHPNTVIETFFTCSHCKHRYTSFVTDTEVRRLQRKIKREITVVERTVIFDEIKRRMATLKHELINNQASK